MLSAHPTEGRPVEVNRTVWGSITPTVSTGTVRLNLSLRCGSGSISNHCVVEVEIPGGSDACQMCSILAAAINASFCAALNGYSAVCDGAHLVVGNGLSDPCPGAKVLVDPEGLGDLRIGTDTQATNNDQSHYLRFYEAASGDATNASLAPAVTLVYTASYPGMQSEQAYMVSVPTGAGMLGDDLSALISAAFADLGITEVVAEGPTVRFDPPVHPHSFEGTGLRARWLLPASPDDPCRTLEILARPGENAFALASAGFDVHVGPGAWTEVEIVPSGATGDPGTIWSEGVQNIRIEQQLVNGVEPAPDPSSELVVWRGTWCATTGEPACVTAQTTTTEFKIFSTDPCAGMPPPCSREPGRLHPDTSIPPSPHPSVDQNVTSEGTAVFSLLGAACDPPPGRFSIMLLVNDGSLGYVLSADPNLRCTVSATDCDNVCVADFNNDGAVNVDDVLDFLAAFDAQNISADLNHDGIVDLMDYELFFWHYAQGC